MFWEQVLPVNPGAHVQVKPVSKSLQVAPLKQGEGKQLFLPVQFFPENGICEKVDVRSFNVSLLLNKTHKQKD